MKKDIAKQLYLEYQKEGINEKVPNINYGGCGAFAEHLYKIYKDLGLKPKLAVITYNRKERIKELKDFINGNNRHGANNVRHVVVIVGKKLIDSEGIYTSVHETKYSEPRLVRGLEIDVLSDWNVAPMWNDTFKRSNIRKIKVILKKAKENLVN